jgi:hypothetical protein
VWHIAIVPYFNELPQCFPRGMKKLRYTSRTIRLWAGIWDRTVVHPFFAFIVNLQIYYLLCACYYMSNYMSLCLAGYWLLHDQHVSYGTNGFDVIFHVGQPNDVPPTPKDFPRCGSWVGPEFFLIWRVWYRAMQNCNPKSSDVTFWNGGQSKLKVLMDIWTVLCYEMRST